MNTRVTYLLVSLFSFLTFTLNVQAQTDEGSFVVNGRTNLQLEFGDDAPFSLGLMGGYFPVDNLALEVDINYDRTALSNRFGIKPFARYYLFKIFFFGAGIRFDSETTNNESESDFSFDLEVGGLIMLTDQVGLEPTLRVPVNRDSNVALLIGFSFFFGR